MPTITPTFRAGGLSLDLEGRRGTFRTVRKAVMKFSSARGLARSRLPLIAVLALAATIGLAGCEGDRRGPARPDGGSAEPVRPARRARLTCRSRRAATSANVGTGAALTAQQIADIGTLVATHRQRGRHGQQAGARNHRQDGQGRRGARPGAPRRCAWASPSSSRRPTACRRAGRATSTAAPPRASPPRCCRARSRPTPKAVLPRAGRNSARAGTATPRRWTSRRDDADRREPTSRP